MVDINFRYLIRTSKVFSFMVMITKASALYREKLKERYFSNIYLSGYEN